jgi:predicted HD phosphohydrolase
MTVFPVLLLSMASLFILSAASGQQPAEKVADGPGADLVRVKCSLCHDLGHITRIRQTREEWDDTIQTMIRRGAPLTQAEVAIIVEYLTKFYGK